MGLYDSRAHSPAFRCQSWKTVEANFSHQAGSNSGHLNWVHPIIKGNEYKHVFHTRHTHKKDPFNLCMFNPCLFHRQGKVPLSGIKKSIQNPWSVSATFDMHPPNHLFIESGLLWPLMSWGGEYGGVGNEETKLPFIWWFLLAGLWVDQHSYNHHYSPDLPAQLWNASAEKRATQWEDPWSF